MIFAALFFIFGYLLGSIPFGLVLCKIFGYGDIREIGSGNIGATNVLRTGNKPLALATLILDIGKGAASVTLVSIALMHMDQAHIPMLFAGAGAILGHMFPIWLKFKGGKGVATTLGTILALHPFLGLSMIGIWLASAAVFKYSSLAALISFAASPVLAFILFSNLPLTIFSTTIAVLVFWKHRDNISRLKSGEESKITFKT